MGGWRVGSMVGDCHTLQKVMMMAKQQAPVATGTGLRCSVALVLTTEELPISVLHVFHFPNLKFNFPHSHNNLLFFLNALRIYPYFCTQFWVMRTFLQGNISSYNEFPCVVFTNLCIFSLPLPQQSSFSYTLLGWKTAMQNSEMCEFQWTAEFWFMFCLGKHGYGTFAFKCTLDQIPPPPPPPLGTAPSQKTLLSPGKPGWSWASPSCQALWSRLPGGRSVA